MRIAQVTDLHLRHHQPGTSAMDRRRSRRMAQLLETVLDRLQGQAIDLLAVTGDLLDVPNWMIDGTSDSAGQDPAFWARAIERDYRLVKDKLDAGGLDYLVVPGNHDLESIMWQVFDASDHTREVGGRRIVRFCDREHEAHFPRRVNPERTRWEQELARTASPPQVHLQHYVITPDLNRGYPHTYADADSLQQAICRSGKVELSLSGHYHRGTDLIHMGSTCFATGPAFCEAPFSWRVYDLNEQINVQHHELGQQPAFDLSCL